MAETDLSDWLPIADAAARIGCSTRTIERLGRAKKLEQRLRPQAGSPAVAVYNPSDVARIAAERQPAPAPFVLPAVQDHANGNGNGRGVDVAKLHQRSAGSGEDPIRQLAALIVRAIQSPPSPPRAQVAETVAETALLTVDEAAARLRVEPRRVERLIRAKRVPVVKLSRFKGDWRIRRRDLEAL